MKKRHGLPEIVRALKTFSSRRINDIRKTPGIPVWQRNYYGIVMITTVGAGLKPAPTVTIQQPAPTVTIQQPDPHRCRPRCSAMIAIRSEEFNSICPPKYFPKTPFLYLRSYGFPFLLCILFIMGTNMGTEPWLKHFKE
jgi:hypothetical protein